jgi:peptidoglycan/LPS O-acetylase OafA/YrhL
VRKAEHHALLDWLRFLAALVVVAGHARAFMFFDYGRLEPKTIWTAAFSAVGRSGHEAVLIFFVLSGFLVGGNAFDRARAGTFDWRTYSADRFARIYTPLVPALALTVAAACYLGTFNLVTALGNVVALQEAFVEPLAPNPPLWSLSYEIWFYIIGGSAAVLMMKRSALAIIVLMIGLSMFLLLDPVYLLTWCIGAAAFFYRPSRAVWLQCIGSSVLFCLGLTLSQLTRASQTMSVDPRFHDLAIIILAAGVAWALSCLRGMRCPDALARMGTKLAAPSYTLYLTHYPLFAVLGIEQGQLTLHRFVIFLALVLLAVVFALVIWFPFERLTPVVKERLRSGVLRRGVTSQHPRRS